MATSAPVIVTDASLQAMPVSDQFAGDELVDLVGSRLQAAEDPRRRGPGAVVDEFEVIRVTREPELLLALGFADFSIAIVPSFESLYVHTTEPPGGSVIVTSAPVIAAAAFGVQLTPVSSQPAGTSSLTVYVPGVSPAKIRDDEAPAPSSTSLKSPERVPGRRTPASSAASPPSRSRSCPA